MPHLKCLIHCGRLKCDNTSAIKMLHPMSVWVVVAARSLVLKNICDVFASLPFLRVCVGPSWRLDKALCRHGSLVSLLCFSCFVFFVFIFLLFSFLPYAGSGLPQGPFEKTSSTPLQLGKKMDFRENPKMV